jgi:hypothetical protein
VDIQAGDTVNVTASPTTSAPVVALSASVNVSSDTVTGTGPADALLLLKVFAEGGGWWTQKSVATGGSGDLNTDLSTEMDLTGASYAYLRYSDASGNQTSIHTTPSSSPRLDQVEQDVEGQGAEVQNSAFGAANGGDLTPPVSFNGGGGKLVFASRGGSLVLTRPDGSVDDTWEELIIVHNAPDGQWEAQVRVNGGEGEQYAIAIGEAEIEYIIYLPLVMRSTGS